MKSLSIGLILATVFVTGCDAGKQASATSAEAAAEKRCTDIVSNLERLACFDAAAGTPPMSMTTPLADTALPANGKALERIPNIVSLVRINESGRVAGDFGFRISHEEEPVSGRSSVVMSAPALSGSPTPPILAISCLSNISRLQLLTGDPVEPNRMNIRLLLDDIPISPPVPWQVLEDGTVIDAGRGLVAIEQLRYLVRAGERILLESDYAPLSGLQFDAVGLSTLMKQQREACHW